jgi:hypothetical protein
VRNAILSVSFLLAALSPAAANLPPPPPPDPATLEETRRLVERLPPSDPRRASWAFQNIEQANAKKAVAWAKGAEPKQLEDRELERLFSLKVEGEARHALPACIPEAKEALAVWYASRLRADEARQITELLSTDVGPSLAQLVQVGEFFAKLEECAYRAVFPKLANILASAVERNEFRRSVNAETRNVQ